MTEDVDQIVDNLKQPSSWIRLIFMVGFAILLYVIIAPVIFVLMLVQALFVLFMGDYNSNLRYLGAALAQYVLQILLFISYNSDVQPFPFTDFPKVDDDAELGDRDDDNDNDGDIESDDEPPVAKPARKSKTAAKKKSPARKSASTKSAKDMDADSKGSSTEG